MAREQVTTVPRRQARGGHVACAPAAGRVSDFSTEAQAPARDNHRGQGMVSVLLLLNVFLHLGWGKRKRWFAFGPFLFRLLTKTVCSTVCSHEWCSVVMIVGLGGPEGGG